jgi:hypothetical protein
MKGDFLEPCGKIRTLLKGSEFLPSHAGRFLHDIFSISTMGDHGKDVSKNSVLVPHKETKKLSCSFGLLHLTPKLNAFNGKWRFH